MIPRKSAAVITALFLCGNLVLSSNALSYRQFSDAEPGTWYASAVEAINDAGLTPPDYGGRFLPGKPVSVAEFSYSLLLSQGQGGVTPKAREAWDTAYLREMSRLMGEELTDGPITRLQAAKMIVAVKQLPLKEGGAHPFADTHDSAAEAVHREGIICGIKKDGQLMFAGDATLTRAQMAVIINRIKMEPGNEPKTRLYAGVNSVGFLIEPGITLPKEPKTSEDFRRVMEYMAVNDLTTVSLEYQGHMPRGFIASTKDVLSDTLHSLRYERSEYFSYLPKTKIKAQPNGTGSYTLTIELTAYDGDTDDMLVRRQEAFSMASAKLEELYQSGALTPEMPDAERANVIAHWVADSTKYVDHGIWSDHTAWSVFANGTGVCDGFASALQLMLNMDNIQCWGQFGHVKLNGEPHQWTLAIIDKELVGIDVVRFGPSTVAFGMSQNEMDQFYTFD